jgi:hypothetical protein
MTARLTFFALLLGGCFDANSLVCGRDGGNCPAMTDAAAAQSDLREALDLARLSDSFSPPDVAPPLPATCQDVRSGDPNAADGDRTLYLGGDKAKPWGAYCRDMAGQPREYLPLAMTGGNLNFSQYAVGGASTGTSVRTVYQRLRIDPVKLLVDVSDQTDAISVGMLVQGQSVVTSMPYGVAADCIGPASAMGAANVDLRGTPFAAAPISFSGVGNGPGGSATYASGDQVVNLTGGGYCGYWGTTFAKGIAINKSGGFQLALVYR